MEPGPWPTASSKPQVIPIGLSRDDPAIPISRASPAIAVMAPRKAGAAIRAIVTAAGLHPELISAEPKIPDVPKPPAESSASAMPVAWLLAFAQRRAMMASAPSVV